MNLGPGATHIDEEASGGVGIVLDPAVNRFRERTTGRFVRSPLSVAQAGGRHAGFLAQRLGRSPQQLLREARGLRARATEHQAKIINREGFNVISSHPRSSIGARAEAARIRHLQTEIRNFTEQASILEELARRLGGGP
ncbi:hypothetical protein HYR99_38285 [Candidatus Poribacteria bacterium]|nr:hypothetical protein [Candidatus Poribacteria bacterium]